MSHSKKQHPSQRQHQDYDKILKDNLKKAVLLLLSAQYGIQPDSLQPLETVLPRTTEKRVDFAAMATHAQPSDNYVLHLEFQTANDPNMLLRMFGYYENLFTFTSYQ